VELEGRRLSIGPLETNVALDRWSNRIDEGTLHLDVDARDVSLTLPVRLSTGSGPRICRLQLQTPAWHLSLAIQRSKASTDRLSLADAPTFETERTQLTWIGGECPPLRTRGDGTPSDGPSEALVDVVEQYVARTARTAARALFDPTPFESIGLLRDSLAFDRLSPFEHRRGRLRMASRPTSSSRLSLSKKGLAHSFDFGVAADRAPCVPPVSSSSARGDSNVASIPASMLAARQADFGIALAESFVTRLVQGGVASGFMCRGLQPPDDAPRELDSLTPRRARLETIGLGDVPSPARLRVAISPGGLPDLELQPQSSTIRLTWRNLTVELYGRVARAPVRLLKLTMSFAFDLSPSVRGTSSRLDFQIDTVDVTEASFQSPWRTSPPDDTDLLAWTRRLLLLLFEDTLALPLPFEPMSAPTLVGTEVRENDMLLLMRLR
jgi:hypothetical protein